jgi:hypothetical protein
MLDRADISEPFAMHHGKKLADFEYFEEKVTLSIVILIQNKVHKLLLKESSRFCLILSHKKQTQSLQDTKP